MRSDTAAVPASVSIPRRVNRPLASGNGGYCPRALPNFFDGAAEISPRRPVPLDSPLDVAREANGSVRVELELLIAPRRAKIARVPDLTIATLSLARAAETRTVNLELGRTVTGTRPVPAQLRVIAYDTAGNRSAETINFRIR
jgi:hypothetical protein